MVGFAFEDGVGIGMSESPIAVFDLGFELTGCPAGVAEEDAEAVHRFVAPEECEQQVSVRAQPDVTKRPDGVAGRLGSAKEKPDRIQINGSAEEDLVVHVCEALQIREELCNGNLGGPVHDYPDRGGSEVIHHEDD